MRFLLSILLIVFFAFIAGRYLPWWSIAIVAFLVGVAIPQRLLRNFLSGFIAIFLLWAGLALWLDIGNEHLLSRKVAELLKLPSSFLLVLVTALVGGLVGGFASLSGGSLRANR
ncbi:MAG: hypothetical protein EOO16_05725 [Chitinophagaceae bacterium]|nr:MAG: hypothetical protein EOO16_05725 [Chitinophagaceae bacterium]